MTFRLARPSFFYDAFLQLNLENEPPATKQGTLRLRAKFTRAPKNPASLIHNPEHSDLFSYPHSKVFKPEAKTGKGD